MSELVRFSVAMPEELMKSLDEYTARRGNGKNRSETIRDLVRDALVEENVEDPEAMIFGTLTMVFNHHANDLRDKLDDIQHSHVEEIVNTVHVHLDQENCLEVVLMRGQSKVIRSIADAILGTKGVLHGQLVVTTMGAPCKSHSHSHAHGHEHGHGYEHGHEHSHDHVHSHE